MQKKRVSILSNFEKSLIDENLALWHPLCNMPNDFKLAFKGLNE